MPSDYVVATSLKNGTVQKTARASRYSTIRHEIDQSFTFSRKVFALLVLQYAAILVLSSPFALVDSFRLIVEPHHNILEYVAYAGIGASFGLALWKGSVYPFCHVALMSLTVFVALEIGLTFAEYSWGLYGYVALGQATANFAVILALLSLEVEWLGYVSASIACLMLAGLWSVVLYMVGLSWGYSCGVALGGWGFTLNIIFCCNAVSHNVSTEEHILAVLFILFPEALLCLAGAKRAAEKNESETQNLV